MTCTSIARCQFDSMFCVFDATKRSVAHVFRLGQYLLDHIPLGLLPFGYCDFSMPVFREACSISVFYLSVLSDQLKLVNTWLIVNKNDRLILRWSHVYTERASRYSVGWLEELALFRFTDTSQVKMWHCLIQEQLY